jgi:hypothetical protein
MQNLTAVFSSGTNQILSFGPGPVPVKFNFDPVPVSNPAKI